HVRSPRRPVQCARPYKTRSTPRGKIPGSRTHTRRGPAMSSPTAFKTIPAQDELSEIPRDLSFHPCTNPAPKVLTAEQIERVNREASLKPFRISPAAEITAIRQYFDGLLAKYLAEGKDSYSISSAHLRHGKVWDILTNPRVVGIVADLLGPSVIAWGSHFF